MKLSIITPVWNGEAWVLKALDSVPNRKDIEIIAIDDCSTDGTLEVLKLYKQYSSKNIIILHNDSRIRASGSINKGLDVAQGTYIMQLDSDDTVNTRNLDALLNLNRHEDLIFFPNKINNGDVWNPKDSDSMCDHCCMYRRSIVGDTRHVDGKTGTGRKFHNDILSKPHTEYYFNRVVYYYNYPREGSNLDLAKKGLL